MVSETQPVRIVVEVSRVEPFRGTIAEGDRPVHAFNGWTAFAAAMAAVLGGIGLTSPDSGEEAGS
jgi:hypothetical protein